MKAQNPDIANKELVRQIGSEWAQMSDIQKQPYHDLSEQDKKRYDQEMEVYC